MLSPPTISNAAAVTTDDSPLEIFSNIKL